MSEIHAHSPGTIKSVVEAVSRFYNDYAAIAVVVIDKNNSAHFSAAFNEDAKIQLIGGSAILHDYVKSFKQEQTSTLVEGGIHRG